MSQPTAVGVAVVVECDQRPKRRPSNRRARGELKPNRPLPAHVEHVDGNTDTNRRVGLGSVEQMHHQEVCTKTGSRATELCRFDDEENYRDDEISARQLEHVRLQLLVVPDRVQDLFTLVV